MMTASEARALRGRTGTIQAGALHWNVTILLARRSRGGQVNVLVRPVAGRGEAWTTLDVVRLLPAEPLSQETADAAEG